MRDHKLDNNSNSLEDALLKCRASAKRGYKIALDNIKETANAIGNVSKTLSQCMEFYNEGSVNKPGIIEQLKEQFVLVVDELSRLQNNTENDLRDRKKRLDRFSITLFGRTMAGKSTLMEILTRGNGKSIGLGAQRTTRDVRNYTWNGLEVTDVPGIAAFQGEKDEELAFQAATQADMVLFLISDDAPQPAEAECLAQVRRLGKPILGICNVKISIDDQDDLLLFFRNKNRLFEQKRLSQIIEQFHAFADRLIPGKHIQFIATHLRSRFLANQHQFNKYESELIETSRFKLVEQRIIDEVTGKGVFLRIKSFIDGAVVPIADFTDRLLEFSEQNSDAGRVLVEKGRQINDWLQDFKTDGIKRIETLTSKLMDGLRQSVPDFVEDHFEDNRAGEKWNALVKSIGINEKSEKILCRLSEDCKKAMQEIARELKSELSLIANISADRTIKMDGIINSKRWWNYGYQSLSGGLLVAGIILGSNPIGWAAAAVGVAGWLFSFLFDDYEKKARQAREKLSKKLFDNINKMEDNLRHQLQEWFYKELIDKQVYALLNDISAIIKALFELADGQRTLGWALNDRIKSLAKILIEEGLKQVNATGMEYHIRDMARIPGCANIFLIAPETKFPDQIKIRIEKLLGESVWFVVDTKNTKSILSQAIGFGCDRNKIHIESKLKIAHVPLDELDSLTRTRVKLAQQLTGLHITK